MSGDRKPEGIGVIDSKGASAVEFALVLPLLIILVFGIIEFSVAFFDKAMITNASREGARAGIVFNAPRVTDDEIIAVVDAYLGDHLITFGPTSAADTEVLWRRPPDVPISYGDAVSGDNLSVTVSYHYDYLVLPGFIAALTGGVDLSATTVMRLE